MVRMLTLNDAESVQILERARSRFEAQVDRANPEGCWPWTGATDQHGYGKVCALPIGKYLKAHRIAWMLANLQPIPAGMVVRHQCDNPACVRPDHLLIGTQADNCSDASSRGRARGGHGEGHRNAKLTWEIVREIRRRRAEGESCAALGREYGVGRDQVSRICTGKVWTEPGQSGPAEYRRLRLAGST